MTRANKLLNRLKESIKVPPVEKYRIGPVEKFHYEVSDMGFDESSARKALLDIQETFYYKLRTRRLINKFRNNLFTTNVKNNIHDVICEIDDLHTRLKDLETIYKSYDADYLTYDEAVRLSKTMTEMSKESHTYRSNVIEVCAFDRSALKKTIQKLKARINNLEDKRDALNATTEFRIELDSHERTLLGIE